MLVGVAVIASGAGGTFVLLGLQAAARHILATSSFSCMSWCLCVFEPTLMVALLPTGRGGGTATGVRAGGTADGMIISFGLVRL